MADILQLRGPRALSEFRLAKLVASLQKIDPGVRSVAAEHRHFIESTGELTAAERSRLERLLDYGTAPQEAKGDLYLVVPRIGTLSPWSSKATDIARNCGLGKVRRIERGTAYTIGGAGKDLSGAAARPHDRDGAALIRRRPTGCSSTCRRGRCELVSHQAT